MKTTTLQLEGLTCVACTKLITKRIQTIADVTDVQVTLPGTAVITGTREISANEVRNVLAETHYTVKENN